MPEEYNGPPIFPVLVGDRDAARLLGVSRSTFLKWDSSGLLGPMSVSPGGIKRRLWIAEELREWVLSGMSRRELWIELKEKKPA